MAIAIKRTSERDWLRKHCENVQVVQRQRPQYHPPKLWGEPGDSYFSPSYTVEPEEMYNVTISKREVEYLAQLEDAMYDTRDSYASYNNPWGENRAEAWIKQQMAEENKEVALRQKYPTLQEAWDQYQFVKKMLGE